MLLFARTPLVLPGFLCFFWSLLIVGAFAAFVLRAFGPLQNRFVACFGGAIAYGMAFFLSLVILIGEGLLPSAILVAVPCALLWFWRHRLGQVMILPELAWGFGLGACVMIVARILGGL